MKWKVGRAAGINIYIHWTFWILPIGIMASTSISEGLGSAANSVLLIFAAFACVVLHEYGHALTARAFGVGTRDITLYPIGGVASLERIPRKPYQEIAIAAAGPAVNVVIAGILGIALLIMHSTSLVSASQITGGPIFNLLAINIALVAFNILPAFPMDGGRVLRAVLAMMMKYETATLCAARTGQVLAIGLGVLGYFSNPMLMLVAGFVVFAAQSELVAVRRQAAYYAQFEHPSNPRPIWYVPTPPPSREVGIVWVEETRPNAK